MADLKDMIKQMKEESIANRKAMEELISSKSAGGKIGIQNLDENLIKIIMTAAATTRTPVPKTEKGAPKEPKTQDDNFLVLNEMEIKAIDDLLNRNNVYFYGKAGTGKSVSSKKIAMRLHKDGYIKNDKMFYVLSCSQWTSPIQILGGWSINGYKEGLATLAWRHGGVLILDELPKLDANTAGLLNDMLSSMTEKNPVIIDGQTDEKIPMHPEFFVIGTGNTDMKTTSMNFSGNNQQDYSLVDRFAGSMYYVDFDYGKELSLVTYPVFAVALGIRNFLLKDANSIESVSLRTMLNFNRIYELEMLRKYFPESPLLANKNSYDTVKIKELDDEGKEVTREVNQGKTLNDSVYSFVNSLAPTKKTNLLAEKLDTIGAYTGLNLNAALALAGNSMEEFKNEYIRLHHMNPIDGKPQEISDSFKKKFERIKEELPASFVKS